MPERTITVVRVAAWFYTWDLRVQGHQVLGYGTKGMARKAVHAFLAKHDQAAAT